MSKPKPTRKARHTGLIGLFGHTYVPDGDSPNGDDTMIQYQFEIIREIKGDRYVVQLFGWFDGDPTELDIMAETELLGPTVKLYSTKEDWYWAHEKECRRRRAGREAREPLKLLPSG